MAFIGVYIATAALLLVEEVEIGSTYIQQFTNPSIVIMSCALFLFFKNSSEVLEKMKCSKQIEWLVDKSLGCNLLHYFIRDCFMGYIGENVIVIHCILS